MAVRPGSNGRLGQLELYPALSFHYGLSFEELARMPYWALKLYIEELPRLLTEVQQSRIQAASFPYMKDGDRERLQRRLRNTSDPGGEDRMVNKPATRMEIGHAAASVGLPMTIVGKDGKVRDA